MDKRIALYIKEHEVELLDEWMKRMEELADERGRNAITGQMYYKTSKDFINIIFSNIMEANETYERKMDGLAINIVRLGWPLTFMTNGLKILGEIIFTHMIEEEKYSPEEKLKLLSVSMNG